MKNYKKIFAALSVVTLFSSHAFAAKEEKSATTQLGNIDAKTLMNSTQVAVTFKNGTHIRVKDVFEKSKEMLPFLEKLSKEELLQAYGMFLIKLINEHAMAEALKTANIQNDQDVKNMKESFKKSFLQEYFLRTAVKELITPQEVRKKYDELLKTFPKGEKEVKLAHILFATKEEAKKALQQITSGQKTFSDCLSLSLDKKSAEKGGVIQTRIPLSQFKEKYIKQIKNAKNGLVERPLSLTKAGYSIVKVVEMRDLEPASFEDAKERLQEEMQPEFTLKLSEKLLKEYDAKFFTLKGELIPEKLNNNQNEDFAYALEGANLETLSGDAVLAKASHHLVIKWSEVKAFFGEAPKEEIVAFLKKKYRDILKVVLVQKIIEDKTSKSNLTNSADFKTEQQEKEKQFEQAAYIEKKIKDKITPEKVQEKYDEIIEKIPSSQEVQLRHISFSSKKDAEEKLKELKANRKGFDENVKKSTDTHTNMRKGDLGYKNLNAFPPAVSKALMKAPKASFLVTPVKTKLVADHAEGNLKKHYSIIYVADKRQAKKPELAQLQKLIVKSLMKEETEKLMDQERKKSIQEIRDLTGKVVFKGEKNA